MAGPRLSASRKVQVQSALGIGIGLAALLLGARIASVAAGVLVICGVVWICMSVPALGGAGLGWERKLRPSFPREARRFGNLVSLGLPWWL